MVSLLATGWMVWHAALIPRVRRETLGSLLVHVLAYTLVAWAWSAVVALSLYWIIPLEDRSDMVPQTLRTAATAVWFGPAMILLSEFSPASLLAALVLVVYASRLLYAQWQPVEASRLPQLTPREPGEFLDCQLPPVFVWRERLPALGVAFCIQVGGVAVAMRYPLLGAAWLCMGTALLTVFSMSTGAADAGRPPTLPKSIIGILATMVLAAFLTLAGGGRGQAANNLLPGGNQSAGQRPSLVETARAVLRQLFYGESPGTPGTPGTRDGGPPPLPEAPDTGAAGGYPGIIIWPEVKPVTILVSPLPAQGNSMIPGRLVKPFSIPFGGEYWMYRWPFSKPPAGSFFQRGSPSKLSFSSTDQRPLEMEAHQKLDAPIDIRCCGKIQVEVLNADHYPGTISLELVLVDSESGWPVLLRLGSENVTSRPDLSRNPVIPMRETLEFTLPSDPPMEQFNEFEVVFRRARVRMDRSAKVSIERFVLLPQQ